MQDLALEQINVGSSLGTQLGLLRKDFPSGAMVGPSVPLWLPVSCSRNHSTWHRGRLRLAPTLDSELLGWGLHSSSTLYPQGLPGAEQMLREVFVE